jgi:predicted nucleic acid-binding protein
VKLVVVDASALVEYILQTRRSAEVGNIIQSSHNSLHVPALCDVEVTAALRRAVITGVMTEERGREALSDYADLALNRHGHLAVMQRILDLRDNFSAYDATYVALAERLDASLLTCDEALARAVSQVTGLALDLPYS